MSWVHHARYIGARPQVSRTASQPRIIYASALPFTRSVAHIHCILQYQTLPWNIGWCYMQGTPAVLYMQVMSKSVYVLYCMVWYCRNFFLVEIFFRFLHFYWPASTTYWYCASPPPRCPNRYSTGGGGYNILARTTRLAQSLGNVPLIRN